MEAAQNLSSLLKLYARGDEVEVVMTEDGLLGSYYHGIIIANENQQPEVYTVLYTNRYEPDNKTPLQEKIPITKLRLIPPTLTIDSFMFYKNVDVYENNGWWAGKIIGKNGFSYTVYFPGKSHSYILLFLVPRTYGLSERQLDSPTSNTSSIAPIPANTKANCTALICYIVYLSRPLSSIVNYV